MSDFLDTGLEDESIREYREMLESFDWDGLSRSTGWSHLVDELARLSMIRHRLDPSSEIWNDTVPAIYHRGLAF